MNDWVGGSGEEGEEGAGTFFTGSHGEGYIKIIGGWIEDVRMKMAW